MLEKLVLKIEGIEANLIEDNFIVDVKLLNPIARTLYAYGSLRRILYENTTGKLTIYLHDGHLSDENDLESIHTVEPDFIPLEGNVITRLKIPLAPVVKRILSASERGKTGDAIEDLRVAEAREIQIEIAHQDTPFYHNPKMGRVKQYKEWGRMVSKASFKITPQKEKSPGKPKKGDDTKPRDKKRK
jgi:hypothetical protein